MTDQTQRRRTDEILDLVGTVNPYNRQGTNLKSEFYIYNMGFLASYLSSLMEEDPFILRRFKEHVKQRRQNKLR
jgi:hypothetical protein